MSHSVPLYLEGFGLLTAFFQEDGQNFLIIQLEPATQIKTSANDVIYIESIVNNTGLYTVLASMLGDVSNKRVYANFKLAYQRFIHVSSTGEIDPNIVTLRGNLLEINNIYIPMRDELAKDDLSQDTNGAIL